MLKPPYAITAFLTSTHSLNLDVNPSPLHNVVRPLCSLPLQARPRTRLRRLGPGNALRDLRRALNARHQPGPALVLLRRAGHRTRHHGRHLADARLQGDPEPAPAEVETPRLSLLRRHRHHLPPARRGPQLAAPDRYDHGAGAVRAIFGARGLDLHPGHVLAG